MPIIKGTNHLLWLVSPHIVKLGAVRQRLALSSASIPIMEFYMVCLEQGHTGLVAVYSALIVLVPKRP